MVLKVIHNKYAPECVIFESASQLPSLVYDFVIIGAGAAGNVLTNRLTENRDISVLVVEAGISNQDALPTFVPFFSLKLSSTIYDWNFTTTNQSGLNNRIVTFPRGRVLGGSTTINGMFYTRGSADDWNRYASVAHDSAWSWERIQHFIQKNEKWIPPADQHNTTGQFNPAFHSSSGINSVSLPGFAQATDGRILQTTEDLKAEFPFNLDMNSGKPLGLGWLQATINDGNRSSSATSYLGSQFINRPNLHVLLHSQVTRLLPSANSKKGRLSFSTVEVSPTNGDSIFHLRAKKEILLSAGTVGTPHILLNSGIGDAKELTHIGIKPILNLSDVGKNLQDHPRLVSNWFAKPSNSTSDIINRDSGVLNERLRQWNDTRTGPLVDTYVSHLAFLRLPENTTIFRQIPDPAAGKFTAHYELGFTNGFVGATVPPEGEYFGITTRVVSPTSRGTIRLNTTHPLDPPLIDPAFLTTDFDILAMREALKSAQRFLAGPAWKGYIMEPFGELANATDEARMDQYIRDQSGTSAHPVGTAQMSARGAKNGVVDPDFRVKGADGLRIIDASVLPFVPSGHTQTPVYILAEMASELIKKSWY
ncbi:pyranose dehydrogenase [Infundibulicybe gibba]|nr:pyranose dehydrogenase [Infundibulicybe gibba]